MPMRRNAYGRLVHQLNGKDARSHFNAVLAEESNRKAIALMQGGQTHSWQVEGDEVRVVAVDRSHLGFTNPVIALFTGNYTGNLTKDGTRVKRVIRTKPS